MYAGSADRSVDSTKRDVFENFKSYNLEKPELIRMDNHLLDRHVHLQTNSSRAASSSDRDRGIDGDRADSSDLRSASSSSSSCRKEDDTLDGMFDVIVTDPPYGIRAGAKKSGTATIQAAFYITKSVLFSPLPFLCICCFNFTNVFREEKASDVHSVSGQETGPHSQHSALCRGGSHAGPAAHRCKDTCVVSDSAVQCSAIRCVVILTPPL